MPVPHRLRLFALRRVALSALTVASMVALGLAGLALPGAPTTQIAHAAERVVVTLRTGASFEGRIVEDTGATFLLETDRGRFPITWADLDAPSWLSARETLLAPGDAAGRVDLLKYATENGLRGDAERLFALIDEAGGAPAEAAQAFVAQLDALRDAEAEALITRGKAHLEAEEFLHALGRFRDALKLAPLNADAVNGIGEAYYHRRDLKAAREHVERALQLEPTHKDALVNRAFLRLMMLDFEGALTGFREVQAQPLAEGRFKTRPEILKAGQDAELATAEEAFDKFADLPLVLAEDYVPIMEGIVAGPGFEQEFRSVTEHYDLRTEVSQEYADLLTQRLELMYDEYERRFSGKGERKTRGLDEKGKSLKFPVLVFKDKKGYANWFATVLKNPRMGQLSGGVYVSAVKHLVFFQYPKLEDTQLVAWHEGMHQYLDYFIAGAPHWFNEGQGDYFGASTISKSGKRVETGATNAWRVGVIAQLLRQERIPSAAALMQLDAARFMKDPAVFAKSRKDGGTSDVTHHAGENYALAWALVHFCLHGERGRWKSKMTAYFRALCDGDPHADIFDSVWGKTNWEKFDAAWIEHCQWLVRRAKAETDGTEVPDMPK